MHTRNRLSTTAIFLAFVAMATQGEAQRDVTCRTQPLDVVFVLDGSRSVRPHNFRKIKAYVKNFTTIFDQIGPEYIQIGVIQYGSLVREEISLNQFQNKNDLLKAIDNIQYMEKGTMTGRALKFLVTTALTMKHGARLDNPLVGTIAMVVTDGRSQDYHRGTVTEWQRKAKAAGVEMYAIGVGRRANDRELMEIASTPKADHKFHVGNFDAIHTVDLKLHGKIICDIDECDLGNHSCTQICKNTVGSYLCQCHDGFTLQPDGYTCLDNDPCRLEPCSHNCTSLTPGRFQCSCPKGLRLGDDRRHCIDFDECEAEEDKCDQICVNTFGSYHCNCSKGFQLEENGYSCSQTDPCESDLCSHGCIVVAPGLFQCSCPEFMTLDGSDLNCILLPPPKPTNLRFTRITHTSARARWEIGDFNESYIDHYVLVYTRADNEGESTLLRFKNRTADLVDLDASVTYNVSVSAVTQMDFSTGTRGNFTTLALGDTVVTLSNSTLTTLQVDWEPAGGDGLTGYEIKYKRKAEQSSGGVGPPPMTFRKIVSPDVYSMVLNDLDPGTTYEVKATPMYGDLHGKVGSDQETTESLVAPAVEIGNITVTGFEVEWSNINYPTAEWTIVALSEKTGEEVKLQVEGKTRKVTLNGLTPQTEYSVNVIGHVEEGPRTLDSPPGNASGTTGSLTAPVVRVTGATDTSLDVYWQEINHEVDNWTVTVFPKDREEIFEMVETDGSENSLTVKQLRPSTQYIVEVVGHLNTNDGEFSSEKGRTVGFTLPAPPNRLHITERGYTHLRSSFEPSGSPADRHDAECVLLGNDGHVVEATITGAPPTFTVLCENLTSSSDYVIRVKTIFKTLNSVAVTAVGRTLTPPPKNLAISSPTTHTLLATWQAPGFPFKVDYYILTFSSVANKTTTKEIQGNQTRFTLMGLLPFTRYSVKLQSVLRGQKSPIVQSFGITLKDKLNIRIGKIGYNTIDILWNPSTVSYVRYYLLVIAPLSGRGVVKEFTVPPEKTQFSFKRLDTATTYKIRLAAVYDDLHKSDFATETATTRALPPIGPLKFTNITATTLRVSWKQPLGDVTPTGYIVTYFVPGGSPTTVSNILHTFILMEELMPSSVYNVTVTAVYAGNILSKPIVGNETTLGLQDEACSCSMYLQAQAQMQNTLNDLVRHIQVLSERIDQLASTRGESGVTIVGGSGKKRSRRSRHIKKLRH